MDGAARATAIAGAQRPGGCPRVTPTRQAVDVREARGTRNVNVRHRPRRRTAGGSSRASSGFEENDSSDLVDLMSPDVIFHFPTSLPYGGTFRGPEGFRAFYQDLFDHYYEYFDYDAYAVLDAGSHVVVPVKARAKAKNGRTMENEHCLLFTVNDGLITEARLYADTAKGRDVIDGLEVFPSAAS
ncbi:nuclear transport factor 2 family protein [Streptomyces sp. NBC_01717]|uniref:nuclear transport factor 2 family protein n=1 Tax=Streptomyces sp. NBC_01717 TaxID=2975918 RepID=UPI002E2F3284|nr:nuclear transport factor 2 family protein [Streptomyces sp. NBC_01717]